MMPKIFVPRKFAEELEARAKEHGLTVERFLEEVFADDLREWKQEHGKDLVEVKFHVPRAISDLVGKLAEIEGDLPSTWYNEAIRGYIEGTLGNAGDVFNVEAVIRNNGLKGIVNVPE